MSRREYKIPCPKCNKPLRHRALSGLRFCANPDCPDYKGIPPIKVKVDTMGRNLVHTMSDESWRKAAEENKGGKE